MVGVTGVARNVSGETIYITGPDLARLAAILRSYSDGKVLRRELVTNLRSSTKPAIRDVQSTVRALPVSARALWSGQAGHSARVAFYYRTHSSATAHSAVARRGLRDAVARGIKLRIRTGARTAGIEIVQDPSNLPVDQRRLPYYMDQGRWRHPLFGNRAFWVEQSAKPYFHVTLLAHQHEYLLGVQKAMERTAIEIAVKAQSIPSERLGA